MPEWKDLFHPAPVWRNSMNIEHKVYIEGGGFSCRMRLKVVQWLGCWTWTWENQAQVLNYRAQWGKTSTGQDFMDKAQEHGQLR